MRLAAFISYRRKDSFMRPLGDGWEPSFPERLRDALLSLGFEKAFLDTNARDGTPIGDHFDKRTRKEVAGCHLVVAPIGANWLDILKQKRAARERDLVEGELRTALQFEKEIVPVLVDDVEMPRETISRHRSIGSTTRPL